MQLDPYDVSQKSAQSEGIHEHANEQAKYLEENARRVSLTYYREHNHAALW